MTKFIGLDYTIEYKKGTSNRVADALSRRGKGEGGVLNSMISELKPEWLEDVKRSYEDDNNISKMLKESEKDGDVWQELGGVIYKKRKVYIGKEGDLRDKIVREVHGSAIGGHSGILATYQRIKRYFFGQV